MVTIVLIAKVDAFVIMPKQCPVIDSMIKDEAEREKFADISHYFGILEVEDVIKSDLSEFVTLVELKDRILMNTFVTNYLQPYKDSLRFEKSTTDVQNLRFRTGLLDASGKRIQSSYASISWKGLRIDQTQQITEKVQELVRGEKIKVFDLSGVLFVSQDIKYVYKLIEALKDSLENCIVNLENNKIHGYDEKYREEVPKVVKMLCEIDNVKYLVLFNNPFCTFDRKDYFQTYHEDPKVLQKLIWIPSHFLKGNGWKSLLKEEEMVQKSVSKVHEEFQKYFEPYIRDKYSKEGWVE